MVNQCWTNTESWDWSINGGLTQSHGSGQWWTDTESWEWSISGRLTQRHGSGRWTNAE